MLIERNGDIFAGGPEVLIHQANCYHTMASGIAKEIRERFPEAYAADLLTPKDSLDKLGTYSAAAVTGPALAVDGSEKRLRYIVNLYSQYGHKDGNRKTSYDAMFEGLMRIRDDARFSGLEFGVPYKIGCGLGGGNWNVVLAILRAVFNDPYAVGEGQPRLCVYRKENPASAPR
jgi:O-acetyl-ADP-ribose deacetylase (regulator of RNase III)